MWFPWRRGFKMRDCNLSPHGLRRAAATRSGNHVRFGTRTRGDKSQPRLRKTKVRFKRLELHVFPVRRALSRDERQHLPRVPPTWPRARSRDLELHTLADPAFPARVRIYEKSKTAPIFKIPVALDSGDKSEQSKVGLMFNRCKNSWEFMF